MRAGSLSHSDVAKVLEKDFTCAWEKKGAVESYRVRENPDQTLKVGGNILSYVCTPDGRVIHVIAGPWAPADYLKQLQLAQDMARQLEGLPTCEATERLRDEHRKALNLLETEWCPDEAAHELLSKYAYSRVGDIEKFCFETLLRQTYAPDKEVVVREVSKADYEALVASMPGG